MVRHKLGENLDAIAGSGTLSDVVFSLVEWLESRNRVIEFIAVARVDNPGNDELHQFEDRHCSALAATVSTHY